MYLSKKVKDQIHLGIDTNYITSIVWKYAYIYILYIMMFLFCSFITGDNEHIY
jgi:hypothetical protein